MAKPKQCVNHSNACDCREWRFRQIERGLQRILRFTHEVPDDQYNDAVQWIQMIAGGLVDLPAEPLSNQSQGSK